MYEAQGNFDQSQQQWQQAKPDPDQGADEYEKEDNSHRPPNAFILYSQAMRSDAQRNNPTLSNTEISRILGRMWKEVPNEIKQQYKQKAAKLQEEFKKQHPDYTYRKARRKRALNELLTKSPNAFPGPFPGAPGAPDMSGMYQMMGGAPQMYPQMNQQQILVPPNYQPQMYFPSMPGMPQQPQQPMGQPNQQNPQGYY